MRPVAALLIALVLIDHATVSTAQNASGAAAATSCRGLSWPVEQERRWFAAKSLSRRLSGSRLKKIDRAVELSLEPRRQVETFLPPEVRAKRHTYSGEVAFFGVPGVGQYQVTLSGPATIDVFENGARLKPTGFTRSNDCPGVSESERVDLAPGDLVLVQITDAATNTIKVAFARAAP